MQIRAATVEDAAGIARAHIDAWRGAYVGLLPQDYLDGMDAERWTRGWTERLAGGAGEPRSAVLVATEADTPVIGADADAGAASVAGFAVVSPSRDDDAPAGVGELVAINLARSAWGRGIGRALLAAATDHLAASGFSRATLWVIDGNERAIRFYRRAGWTPDGSTKTQEIGGAQITEVRFVRDLPA